MDELLIKSDSIRTKDVNLNFLEIKKIKIIYSGYKGEHMPGIRSGLKKGTRNYIIINDYDEIKYKYELLFEHKKDVQILVANPK